MAWSNMLSYFSFPYLLGLFQGRLRPAEMGTHTIKSHGARVARDHVQDWLILLLLLVIEIILYEIHPFYRFVGEHMMTDLKYPLKENTVPLWSVPFYAVLFPFAVFLIVYTRRKDVYDLHHSTLGLLFSVLITAVITDAIKVQLAGHDQTSFGVAFLMRLKYASVSGPFLNNLYDRWGNAKCHGKESDIREGHKSFPSGHTSWSFAGLGFLSIYLSGKIKAFDHKGHVAKLCVVFSPLLAASLIGISRVDDYMHHWQDVFAGGLLGLVVAAFCYSQLFPPPYNNEGWGPYEYFRALEESRSSTNSGSL